MSQPSSSNPTEPSTALARLRQGLRDALRSRSFTLQDMSGLLGHHSKYLSRVVSGDLPLKVQEAFEILALVKVDPELFLYALFPFGSSAAAGREPRESSIDRLLRLERAQRGEVLTPDHLARKARRVLKDTLRRRGHSQRQASLALGLRVHTLPLALRANTRLTWEHVFGVLAVCEASPGRFVMDLFGNLEGDLYEQLDWSTHLDELEELFLALERGPAEPTPRPWLPIPPVRPSG